MPERADLTSQVITGVVFVLFATFAATFENPARADSACVEQPGLVAEGTHWVLHHDRVTGRECWILVDTFGRETALWGGPLTMPQTQSSAVPPPTVSSQHESMLGNLNFKGKGGPIISVTPERGALEINHPNPAHKLQGHVANVTKPDNGVRTDQKSNGKGHALKSVPSVLLDPEESAQFPEFLRWRERQQQFEEFLRWRERRQFTGAMRPQASSR
jgi:hypothetical protein